MRLVETIAVLEQDHGQEVEEDGAWLPRRVNIMVKGAAWGGHTCMLRRVPGLTENMFTAAPINIPKTMATKGSGTARSRVIDAQTKPINTVPSRHMEKKRPQLSRYIRLGAVSQLSPS